MFRKPVVFLDRDGTINRERGHIKRLEDFELLAGVSSAIKTLNQGEIKTIVITNQSGIARGYYDEAHVQSVNMKMEKLLNADGAFLDGLYYCPHLTDGNVTEYSISCKCRKPSAGLVEKAYYECAVLDRSRSYVVGDTDKDMGLALNCGAKAILVKTGKGLYFDYVGFGRNLDFVADSLVDAVYWILNDLKE